MFGQEKVARTRLCVSGREAFLVFLQLLAKEIACVEAESGGSKENLGLRRPGWEEVPASPGRPLLSLHKLFLWPKVARTPKRPPHSQKHKIAFLQLFPALPPTI